MLNTSVSVSGGYPPRATCDITIDEMQLTQALNGRLDFFKNRFSGLVYGIGVWNYEADWWNGKIPMHYMSINVRM